MINVSHSEAKEVSCVGHGFGISKKGERERERRENKRERGEGFTASETAKLNRAAFMLCDIFKPLALPTYCQISNLEIFIVTGISSGSLSSQKNCHQTVLADLVLLSDFFYFFWCSRVE